MDRHFKFIGLYSSMKDFTAIVKLSLFMVKKKRGGRGGTSLPFKSGVRKGAY